MYRANEYGSSSWTKSRGETKNKGKHYQVFKEFSLPFAKDAHGLCIIYDNKKEESPRERGRLFVECDLPSFSCVDHLLLQTKKEHIVGRREELNTGGGAFFFSYSKEGAKKGLKPNIRPQYIFTFKDVNISV